MSIPAAVYAITRDALLSGVFACSRQARNKDQLLRMLHCGDVVRSIGHNGTVGNKQLSVPLSSVLVRTETLCGRN